MSFLNRFLIEEDIQFECAGVLEHKHYMYMRRNVERNLVKNLERVSKESNSDFIGHLVLSHDFIYLNEYSIYFHSIHLALDKLLLVENQLASIS